MDFLVYKRKPQQINVTDMSNNFSKSQNMWIDMDGYSNKIPLSFQEKMRLKNLLSLLKI